MSELAPADGGAGAAGRWLPVWPAWVGVFAVALLAARRMAGASPLLWIDTINDERDVRACLLRDACNVVGQGASIPGLYVGSGWLQLRALLAWLGLSVDGVHGLLQILNATAVLLVARAAWRARGHAAAALSALFCCWLFGTVTRSGALYNSALLPFLGAVFLAAGCEARERPGYPSVALMALVAAVMANVHAACATSVASVVAIALLGGARRRWALAASGALIFAVATFVSPRRPGSSTPPGRSPRTPGRAAAPSASASRWPASCRSPPGSEPPGSARRWGRQLQAPFAIILPPLGALVVGGFAGVVSPDAKYVSHLDAPIALGSALIFAAAGGALGGRFPAGARALASRVTAHGRALPYLAVAAIAWSAPSGYVAWVARADALELAFADVDPLAREPGTGSGGADRRCSAA